MNTGLDRLLGDERRLGRPGGVRVGLLANPASMTGMPYGFEHAMDALAARLGHALTVAFGSQHEVRGDKRYNMEESAAYFDPKHGIPVFSLYGDVRRPTTEMLDHFDVLVFDVQDVGWRGYTWVTVRNSVAENPPSNLAVRECICLQRLADIVQVTMSEIVSDPSNVVRSLTAIFSQA